MSRDDNEKIVELYPAEGLTKRSDSGDKTESFALFIDEWFQMQSFVTGALGLPISIGDFAEKYGDFDETKKGTITDCVAAFGELRASAEVFGNPETFLEERSELESGDKPASLYGKIVWTANRIAVAADQFKYTYTSLGEVFSAGMSSGETEAALVEILTGKGGLRDEAVRMRGECNDLVQELAGFASDLEDSRKKIVKYVSDSSDIYAYAQVRAGELDVDVVTMRDDIRKKKSEFEAWTAAAAGGAAAVVVVTGGLAWPIALAWGLGAGFAGADEARKALEEFEKELASLETEQQQKAALVLDLTGLNGAIAEISGQVNAVVKALQEVAAFWDQVVFKLEGIVDRTELEKLMEMSSINIRLNLSGATQAWAQVAATTRQFTSQAFVTVERRTAA